MWCVPKVTPEFIKRMEDILDLYAKPYNPHEPVLCFDEKSKQLINDTRPAQRAKEKRLKHRDYEAESGKYFRIIPIELAFYREHKIPLPRNHPLVRLASWRKDIDLRLTFHDRSCPKCGNVFKTPYKPNQFQGKVYCEECYKAKVI